MLVLRHEDCHPEMSQKAMQLNAELNNVELTIVGDYRETKEEIDLISVADVLYDRDNLPLLDALIDTDIPVLLADSRVRNFSHPKLDHIEALPCLGWDPPPPPPPSPRKISNPLIIRVFPCGPRDQTPKSTFFLGFRARPTHRFPRPCVEGFLGK